MTHYAHNTGVTLGRDEKKNKVCEIGQKNKKMRTKIQKKLHTLLRTLFYIQK